MKDNKGKAELFARHLENIFQPNEELDSGENGLVIENQESEEIPLATPSEIQRLIYQNLNTKKAPGFDLITSEVLKQLPRKGIVKLTYLINAAFRLKHVPGIWKAAEVIMIPKTGKPPNETSSYRPISLLPIISKLFEKLLLRRLMPIIERKKLIPSYQFGFRNNHSTIEQMHRVTNIIEKALEEKKICSATFLDVAQAFDKVWHEGLLRKLNNQLPKQYVQILESYISNRLFRVKLENEFSDIKQIKAGVPQGSVLGPILYLLYTSDAPGMANVTVATFADDTALLAVGSSIAESTSKLQQAVSRIYKWTRKWRIRLNETKSVHVNFTNRKYNYLSVRINNIAIPHANTAKYLGMTLDAKLRWKEHIKKKREELGLNTKKCTGCWEEDHSYSLITNCCYTGRY